MAFVSIFGSVGSWAKGQTHTHTNRSDGAYAPAELVRKYRELGYAFVFITDHNKITKMRGEEVDGIKVFTGEELSYPYYHLVVLGLGDYPAESMFNETAGIIDAARLCREQNRVSILAHTNWFPAFHESSMALLRRGFEPDCVEAFNGGCWVDNGIGANYDVMYYNISQGKRFGLIASDDTHFDRHFNQGFVVIKTDRIEEDAAVQAIKARRYYSSNGLMIEDITINDSGKVVVLPAAEYPIATVRFMHKNYVYPGRKGPTTAPIEFELPTEIKNQPFALELIGADGSLAWTNIIQA